MDNRQSETREELSEAFKLLDTGNKGYLDHKELRVKSTDAGCHARFRDPNGR